MRCSLTDKKIASLKGQSQRTEYWDTKLSGFGVRVTPAGKRTFFVMCRERGKQKRLTLGYYPIVTLSEARELAREKLRLADQGFLFAQENRKILTVKEAFEIFLEMYAKKKNKDWRTVEVRLKNNFIKEYGEVDLRKITRQDINTMLDKIIARDAPIQANRVLAAVSRFMGWCVERGYIESSPVTYIKKPAKENPRERILSDEELLQIYNYIDALSYPFGPLLKIIILTGQRKGEVAGMRWSEVDITNKIWEIPKDRSKNGRSHIVPLSQEVLKILESLPRFLHSDLVFTTTGRTSVSGFGKIKKRMDDKTEVADWIIHDLRRTAASGMAKLEVPPHVVEKILNHVSGTFSGVAGVYNRYGYDKEKREALNIWADHVLRVVKNDRSRMVGS